MNKQNYIKKAADIIVNHSLQVKQDDRVLIRFKNQETMPLILAIIDEVFACGGMPFVKIAHPEIDDSLMSRYKEKDVEEVLKRREFDVLNHECFISLGYNINFERLQGANNFRKVYMQRVRDINKIYDSKRWVLINYPSQLDAEKLNMSYNDSFNKLMNYICVDYKSMHESMLPLKNILDNAKKVQIVAPDTNLSFSIEGISSQILSGEFNLPDGEIFTAPIRESINGYIQYNVDSSFMGNIFKNIRLEFKDGKVVSASCSNGKDDILNDILNQDEGARYVGEFAFGTNKNIVTPITDTLYDEKMIGSIHLALGNCYEQSNNGNHSSIHWDMIKGLSPKYGGGKVLVDGKVVLEDGDFVLDELKSLNRGREERCPQKK